MIIKTRISKFTCIWYIGVAVAYVPVCEVRGCRFDAHLSKPVMTIMPNCTGLVWVIRGVATFKFSIRRPNYPSLLPNIDAVKRFPMWTRGLVCPWLYLKMYYIFYQDIYLTVCFPSLKNNSKLQFKNRPKDYQNTSVSLINWRNHFVSINGSDWLNNVQTVKWLLSCSGLRQSRSIEINMESKQLERVIIGSRISGIKIARREIDLICEMLIGSGFDSLLYGWIWVLSGFYVTTQQDFITTYCKFLRCYQWTGQHIES